MSEQKTEPLTVSVNESAPPQTSDDVAEAPVLTAAKDSFVGVRQSVLDALVVYQARRISELERLVEIKRAKVERLSAVSAPLFHSPNFPFIPQPHPAINTVPLSTSSLTPASTPLAAPPSASAHTPTRGSATASAPTPTPAPLPASAPASAPTPASAPAPLPGSVPAPTPALAPSPEPISAPALSHAPESTSAAPAPLSSPVPASSLTSNETVPAHAMAVPNPISASGATPVVASSQRKTITPASTSATPSASLLLASATGSVVGATLSTSSTPSPPPALSVEDVRASATVEEPEPKSASTTTNTSAPAVASTTRFPITTTKTPSSAPYFSQASKSTVAPSNHGALNVPTPNPVSTVEPSLAPSALTSVPVSTPANLVGPPRSSVPKTALPSTLVSTPRRARPSTSAIAISAASATGSIGMTTTTAVPPKAAPSAKASSTVLPRTQTSLKKSASNIVGPFSTPSAIRAIPASSSLTLPNNKITTTATPATEATVPTAPTALNARPPSATPTTVPLVGSGPLGISASMAPGAIPLQLAHPLSQVPMMTPHLAMPPPTHLHAANPAFAAALAAATQGGNTPIPFPMHPQFPFLFLPPDGSLGMAPLMHPTAAPTPPPHGTAIACAPPSNSQAHFRQQSQPPQQTQIPVTKPTQSTNPTSEQGDRKQSRYWTPEEHQRFLAAVIACGPKNYGQISEFVGTRNAKQVRTHAQKFQKRLEREEAKRRGAIGSFAATGSMTHAAAAALSAAALGASPALAAVHSAPARATEPRTAGEMSIGAAPSDGTGRTGEGSSSDNSAATDSRILKKGDAHDDASIAAAEAAAAAVAAEAVALGRGILSPDLLQGIAPKLSSTVDDRSAVCNPINSMGGGQPPNVSNSISPADIVTEASNLTSSNPGKSETPTMLTVKQVGLITKKVEGGISAEKISKLLLRGAHGIACSSKASTAPKAGGLMKIIPSNSTKGDGSQIDVGVKSASGISVRLPTGAQTTIGKKFSVGAKPGLKVNVPTNNSGTPTGKASTGHSMRPLNTGGKINSGGALTTKARVTNPNTGQKVLPRGAASGVIRRVTGTSASTMKLGVNIVKNGKILPMKNGVTLDQVDTDGRSSPKLGMSCVQEDGRKNATPKLNGNDANAKANIITKKSTADGVKHIGVTNDGTVKSGSLGRSKAEVINAATANSGVVREGIRGSGIQRHVPQNAPKNGIKLNSKGDTTKGHKVGNNIGGTTKPVIKQKFATVNTSKCRRNESNQLEGSKQNAFETRMKQDIVVDMAAAEDIVNEILGGEMSNDDEELGEIGSAVVVSKECVELNSQRINGAISPTGKRSVPDDVADQEAKRRKYDGNIENVDAGQMGEPGNDTIQTQTDGDDVEAEMGQS